MTDTDRGPHPDGSPPADSGPGLAAEDRSDIEQAVMARSDALARGEGGPAPEDLGGEGGAGGVVKNQAGLDQ